MERLTTMGTSPHGALLRGVHGAPQRAVEGCAELWTVGEGTQHTEPLRSMLVILHLRASLVGLGWRRVVLARNG